MVLEGHCPAFFLTRPAIPTTEYLDSLFNQPEAVIAGMTVKQEEDHGWPPFEWAVSLL